MAHRSTSSSSARGPAARRLGCLFVLAGAVAAVAAVRRSLLSRDQVAFDRRYGSGSDGSRSA